MLSHEPCYILIDINGCAELQDANRDDDSMKQVIQSLHTKVPTGNSHKHIPERSLRLQYLPEFLVSRVLVLKAENWRDEGSWLIIAILV